MYCDGFVVPVPRAKLDAYREVAELACRVWTEHGAIDYREFVADDVKVGERTSFPRSVHLEDDEVVVFSYILYRSREERDAVNAKVMEDPRMQAIVDATPFDGKRLIYGGFEEIALR